MRTLVISDLHLGASTNTDVLRRPAIRDRLVAALGGIDRLVILGDGLERLGAVEADHPVLLGVDRAQRHTALGEPSAHRAPDAPARTDDVDALDH